VPGFTQRLYTQQPGRTQHITIMLALHGSEGKSGSEAERIGFSGLSGFFRILSGLSGFTRILNGLSGFCRPCAVIVSKRVQLLPGARRLSQTIGFSGLSGFSRILSGLSGGLPHSERVERVLSPVRCDRLQAGSVTAGRASTEPDDRV
jgi:hypothetical protein